MNKWKFTAKKWKVSTKEQKTIKNGHYRTKKKYTLTEIKKNPQNLTR